jgi:microcystin degradation protein MlrC
VSKDFYAEARNRYWPISRPRAPLEACCSICMGAMVVEGLDDGEGDLLGAVRAAVGPVPIA